MRILYFSRGYGPHDYRFLSSLAASGYETFFLRLQPGLPPNEHRPLPDCVQSLEWNGLDGPVTAWRTAALVPAFRRILALVRPDVVHAGPVQSAAFLAALAGARPLATMSWGSDLLVDSERSRIQRWITRFTLKRSTVLLADCQTVADTAAQYGFPPGRTVIFPWGVDLEQFSPGLAPILGGNQLRRELDWQDAFVVLSLRNWEPIYGVDVLARGFAIAAAREPRLRLLLAGGGSQAEMIQAILREGEVSDRVHFAGQVSNEQLPGYYRAADLYASASHSDGSSVSLMEALASGRPVLLSDIPSNREWIREGEHGYFFRDGSPESFATILLRAVAQSEHLPAMGRAARGLAEQRADWRKNFAVLQKGYLLARRLA